MKYYWPVKDNWYMEPANQAIDDFKAAGYPPYFHVVWPEHEILFWFWNGE